MPWSDRLVEVIAHLGSGVFRIGSGCVVANGTVLTAAHVVADASVVTVRDARRQSYVATVDPRFVGDVAADGPDLALLQVDDLDDNGFPPLRLARVVRDAPEPVVVERCHAMGYPSYAATITAPGSAAVRETVQAVGTIAPLSGLVDGLLRLVVADEPAQPSAGGSPWSGMSGGPVMAEGCLLGVVVQHAIKAGRSTITLTPLTALGADPATPSWGAGVPDPGAWWRRLAVTGPADLRPVPDLVTRRPDGNHPAFEFANEDFATPEELAEAMASRGDAAVQVFVSDTERAALRDWMIDDVGDQRLNKRRLRRDTLDLPEARAAVAEFVSTFAPHTPPTYAGRPAHGSALRRLCATAIADGGTAAHDIIEIRQKHVLRLLARHHCLDVAAHGCAPGGPCTVLQSTARRWDAAVADLRVQLGRLPQHIAVAVVKDVTLDALLLAALLDPDGPGHALRRTIEAGRPATPGPEWWPPLHTAATSAAAEAALAPMILAELLQEEAEAAHRAAVRRQEEARRAADRREMLAREVDEAARAEAAARVVRERHQQLAAAQAAWKAFRRRVVAGIVAAALVATAVIAFPYVGRAWDAHQRDRAAAEARQRQLDQYDREGCGLQSTDATDNTIAVVLHEPVNVAWRECGIVDVVLDGRALGSIALPDGLGFRDTANWFVVRGAGDRPTAVVTVIRNNTSQDVIAVAVADPVYVLWRTGAPATGGPQAGRSIRLGNVLAFTGVDATVALDLMNNGNVAWTYPCPAGQKYGGLFPSDTPLHMVCDNTPVILNAAGQRVG